MSIVFDDLQLLIITKVKSCPVQIINQRLYWAARLFLDRSEVWTYNQTQDIKDNQYAYITSLPSTATHAYIKRLASAWYGQDSFKAKVEARIDTEQYNFETSILGAIVADTTVPSTPDPAVKGTYFASGMTYESNPVYIFGEDLWYLWYDGAQWNISNEVGNTDESFIGAGGTIAGDYSAVGTASGSVAITSTSGAAITFNNPYTSDLDFGLTTSVALVPALDYTSEIPSEIMDEWGVRGIMECALWSLKTDVDQPWEDQDGAKINFKNYMKNLNDAIRQRYVKRKSGDLTVRPRYYA